MTGIVFYAAFRRLPAFLLSRARRELVNFAGIRVPNTSSPPLGTAKTRFLDFLTESPLLPESRFLSFLHFRDFDQKGESGLFLAGPGFPERARIVFY